MVQELHMAEIQLKKKEANNGLHIKITGIIINTSRTSKLQHTEPRRAEPLIA